MAYDYIGLVNDVNRRLNEVELVGGTGTGANFLTAKGEYSMVKDSVNAAIRYINQHEFEWPYNHIEETETLTAGITRYAYPADADVKFCPAVISVLVLYKVDLTNHLTLLIVAVSRNLDQSTL